MLSGKRLAIHALLALLSCLCLAQLKQHDPGKVLTRISYHTTYGVDWRRPQSFPQVCFALYRNGSYRLTRMTEDGLQGLQGTLSKDQVSHLGELLRNLDTQRREDGIVRQGSESLEVEMATKAKRYTWIDADHRSPFPESVVEVVRWLQRLKARDESPLTLRDLSDQPVCPPASEKPVQPITAEVNGTLDEAVSCGKVYP